MGCFSGRVSQPSMLSQGQEEEEKVDLADLDLHFLRKREATYRILNSFRP